MNEVIKAIKNRRSIRNYLPEQIKDEELETIIEAGIHAPTAHNDQPWHFTIIQKRELIDFISEESKELMKNSEEEWKRNIARNGSIHLLYNAPTVFVVSGRKYAVSPLVDCSAAIENMLLAAESLGIGSCWIGLVKPFFTKKDNLAKLNIPAGYEPYYAFTLGYKSNNNVKAPERKRDVVNYIR